MLSRILFLSLILTPSFYQIPSLASICIAPIPISIPGLSTSISISPIPSHPTIRRSLPHSPRSCSALPALEAYNPLKKLSSLIPFRLATRLLLMISLLRSSDTIASSPSTVRSLLCSWIGIEGGISFDSFDCLRVAFMRCLRVGAVGGRLAKRGRKGGADGVWF